MAKGLGVESSSVALPSFFTHTIRTNSFFIFYFTRILNGIIIFFAHCLRSAECRMTICFFLLDIYLFSIWYSAASSPYGLESPSLHLCGVRTSSCVLIGIEFLIRFSIEWHFNNLFYLSSLEFCFRKRNRDDDSWRGKFACACDDDISMSKRKKCIWHCQVPERVGLGAL